MEKILFVGNGINRIHSNYSWFHLLQDLKKEYSVESIDNGSKPFPILYEEIYFRLKESKQIAEKDLIHAVISKMQQLQPNEIHKQIMTSKVRHVITTNYDDTLEQYSTFKPTRVNMIAGKQRESVYRITTASICGDTSIWHVHGESKYPQTIVLGQSMYARVVKKISEYIEQDTFLQEVHSWIDHMFLDEVHMLGFGLDYSEIDIWAVLNARVRYYFHHPKKNTIYFYLYQDNPKEVLDIESILESYDIKVIKNKPQESAETFYKRILGRV